MSMDIDGESMKTGAYFQGDSMILQRGDASLPLIGYKLNSTDAAAMSGMAAMERYLLALRTDTPAQGVDMDWNAALTAVGQLLTDNESKIVTAAESVTAGENSFEAAVCSLTISGYEASQAFSVFIDGWRRDFRCGDMLSMFDAFKEDETPPTLERLASLAAGGGEATLTLKTGVYQNIPVMLEMAYAGVNGECRLGMLFWEQEGNSYSSISLRFPGGDGFSFVDKAAPGGNSTAHSFYGAYNTLLAESLLSSTGSGDGGGFSSQFSYVMTDYTDEDAPEGEKLKSYGNYSHSVIGKVINGSFSGKLLSSEDENKSMAFSGTVNLSEDFGQPMIPEFIEGSGRTASTRRELFAELYAGDEDMVPEEIMRKFEASPALILPLIGNMILFRE